MQFPESWLREFCDPPITSQALADLLTMAGIEVEDRRPVAPPFSGVVVGAIVSTRPHPQADRLQVCEVDGGRGLLQVVCGAPNARAGLRVPLAMPGANLPAGADGKPVSINVGVLRGVESHGMLCSARELKLSDEHAGLLELAEDAPVGADIRAWLNLDDTLFTLKLTPNLGHALSVYGVAREVAALTGAPLKTPGIAGVAPRTDAVMPVRIEAPDLCGRFSGRVVRGLDTHATTPGWMAERLLRCGQRPVSALVDISNYVMFEYGRPSHIFDLDKINGDLVVRWGRAGEQLELLNGNTIEVDEQVGVIADDAHVESLAGIMGGEATAVSDATRNVYIEAAFWWPESVAGRSRRYNFATEAGHRFERGVDPSTTAAHLERITQLVLDICGGSQTVCGPVDDQVVNLRPFAPVTMRVSRAAKVIGMDVTQRQCADVFRRLGFSFAEADDRITVSPPSWRFDLKIEEDLIEEVARIIGYERLPATPPMAPVTARLGSENRRTTNALRRSVAALGYQETINFSFVEARWEQELAGNPDPIRVLNPIAAPLAVMRSSLIGSLIAVLRYNLARKASTVRVFEIGRVFLRDASAVAGERAVAGVAQPMRLAALASGAATPLQWGRASRAVDFFDAKGEVEMLLAPSRPVFVAAQHPALHPGRCARVEIDGRVVGHVGELHPRWRRTYELPSAPVVFELDLEGVLERPLPAVEPIARQQSAWRDVALVVGDGIVHGQVAQALGDDALIRQVTLFDVYKPAHAVAGMEAHERSLAFRLEILDAGSTLTDERIDAVVAAAIERAARRLGARLRDAGDL